MTFTITGYYPQVYLVSPNNNEILYGNSSSITSSTFTYNVSSQNEIINCSLIIDGLIVSYNTSQVFRNQTNNNIEYTLSTNAIYTWSINCSDTMYYVNNSETRTLNIQREYPETPSGHGSGSGTGGSGGTQSSISDIEQTEYGTVYTIPTLITPITIQPTALTEYIESIIIHPARETSNAKVSIEELQNIPIQKPNTDIIKFIKIETENIPNSVIYQVIFNFKVPKSEIKHNIIELQHHDNGNWKKLPTKLTREDNNFNYYEATSTSLSYFAITTSKPTYQEKVAKTIFPRIKQKLTRLTKKEIILYAVLPLLIIAILIVLMIRFIYKKLSKHKKLRRFIFIATPIILIGLFIPLEKDILLYAILPLSIITIILYSIIHFIIKKLKQPKVKKKK